MAYIHAVKKHIKAKTPKALEREMLKNNIRLGMYIPYTDISKSSDGYWYAWYLHENQDMMSAAKELDASDD